MDDPQIHGTMEQVSVLKLSWMAAGRARRRAGVTVQLTPRCTSRPRPALSVRDPDDARDAAGRHQRRADHDDLMEGTHGLVARGEAVSDERARDDDADDRHTTRRATRAMALLIADAIPASLSSASASTAAVSGATVIDRPSEKFVLTPNRQHPVAM